jgi:hypothetical protein
LQTITATPPENQQFVLWSGSGITDPASPTTTVLIDSAKTVTANFAVIDPYQTWLEQNELGGEDAAHDADPDGDGLFNLIEYAFGTDPNISTPSPVQVEISSDAGSDYLTIAVPKNPLAINVILAVEFSPDLLTGSWSSAGAVVLDENNNQIVIRDPVAVRDAARRFARVRAVIQP